MESQRWGWEGDPRGPDAAGMAAMRDAGDMGEMALVIGLVIGLALFGVVFLTLLLRRSVVGDPEMIIRSQALRRFSASAGASQGSQGPGAPSGEVEAFLIIPDISGYTEFMRLNRLSLAHAQYAVSALLSSIIDAAAQCLAIAKVEGDAVFLYAVQGAGDGHGGVTGKRVGQTVVDILQAFYRKRDELQAGNTCPCEACRNVANLELKAVVHGGKLLLYDLRSQQELSGMPVIVAHRLLKNSLGLARYVLVSEEIQSEVPIPLDAPKTRHVESYEGVGEVATYDYAFEPETLIGARDQAAAASLGAKATQFAHKARENLRGLSAGPEPRS